MFKKFDKNTFQLLNNQWNVLALVGNGFDISVLRKFKKGKMAGKTTSYTDFYDYITYFNLTNHNNILYQKMTESKEEGKENWSDFEDIIKNIYEDKNINHENLEKSIDEFQKYFTIFLNDLVDSDILLKLNEEVINNELSIQSLGEFLKDLDYSNLEDLKFKENLYHYNLFNFVFVNFNYTSLLDNYIYLDKLQFDPHIYKTRDTNFHFKFKLENSNTETDYSTYIISDIIHPHGLQDVPRSILFGIDLKEYNKGGTSTEKRFVKGYWSQYEAKYKSFIEKANLFIIFGMSLGQSDSWWMDAIYNEIKERDAELIIYKFETYKNDEEKHKLIDEVKNKFINVCIRHEHSSDEEKNKVKNNIHVVIFNKNDTYFLGLEKK